MNLFRLTPLLAAAFALLGPPSAANAQGAPPTAPNAAASRPAASVAPASTPAAAPTPAAYPALAAQSATCTRPANAWEAGLRMSLLEGPVWLNCSPTDGEVAAWKREFNFGHPTGERLAQLHVWLGDYALAHDQDPETAKWHYLQVEAECGEDDPLLGIASFHHALALYKQGAFAQSARELSVLVRPATMLPGYDRREIAMWLRQAGAVAGYHAQHAAMGIMEFDRLNPQCAAASLAACLRGLSMGGDERAVLAAVHVTGEGSSVQDLIDAGPKLGVNVTDCTSSDEGLIDLPKPLIAHVEHDHFVAVVAADSSGVKYTCVDCGGWYGKAMSLTWKQWDALEADGYTVVTQPGSPWDREMSALQRREDPSEKVASLGDVSWVGSALLQSQLLRDVTVSLLGANNTGNHCGQPPRYPIGDRQAKQPKAGFGSGAKGSAGGIDPINLATGGEDYVTDPDLTVYNPVGPSVSWSREYHSLKLDLLATYDTSNFNDDFGRGWSQSYSVAIVDSLATPTVASGKTLYFPDGTGLMFNASGSQMPSPTLTDVSCVPETGAGILIDWCWDSNTSLPCYIVRFKDRTTWVFRSMYLSGTPGSTSGGSTYVLSQITGPDQTVAVPISPTLPETIHLNYGTTAPLLLQSITDSSAMPKTLLTINRATDGSITSVSDCYNRSVYYTEQAWASQPYPAEQLLMTASQVVATGAGSQPVKTSYGYSELGNLEGSETVPYLTTVTVPSAANATQTAHFTIDYDPYTTFVSDVLDSELNMTTISSATDPQGDLESGSDPYEIDSTPYTVVTVANANTGLTTSRYVVDYATNGDELAEYDAAGTLTGSSTYNDAYNPYKPTMVTDGDGVAHSYTYDHNGNLLTDQIGAGPLTKGGLIKFYNYSYANFPLGELTSTNTEYFATASSYPTPTSELTPTTYAYYEPSGRLKDVWGPLPGTVAGLSSFLGGETYDSLGNVTQIVSPGPNSGSSSAWPVYPSTSGVNFTTTSYTYGTGTADAIGEPSTVTTTGYNSDGTTSSTSESFGYASPLGNQGNVTSVVDALGNETDTTYDIANDPATVTQPHSTVQSNPTVTADRDETVNTYQYPDGPLANVVTYDQTGAQVRNVVYTYGSEAEVLGVTGTPDQATYVYDPMYRVTSMTNGDGKTTRWYYNEIGNLQEMTYPGYAGSRPNYTTNDGGIVQLPLPPPPSPVMHNGTWSWISGNDVVQYASYSPAGRLLQMNDAKSSINYQYNDTTEGGQLAEIWHTSQTSPDMSYGYDVFNRLTGVTDTQGTKSYTLDDQGGELTSATTYTGVPSQGIGYAYDPDGSRRTMTTPAGTTQYAYDGLGRLGTLTDPYGSVTGYGYYANGWPHAQSLPNAVSTYYSYDAQGELVGQQSGIDSGGYNVGLTSYGGFGYDGAGDRLGFTTALCNTPRYSGPVTYGYDTGGLGELVGQTSSGSGGSFYNYAHKYDGAGNPTTFRNAAGLTYGPDDQPTGTGNSYDGNGNPTTYGSATNVFDAFNRMTSTTSSSGNVYTLGYTGGGLRAWNQYDGGAKNYFLYDGSDPVVEFGPTGTVNAVNTFGATGLVSRSTGSGTTYYVYDPDGNVAFRTGGSVGSGGGTFTYVASPDLYDAYGSTYYSALASDPWGFGAQNGYYSDPEDGLIWCGHRYYDPGKGRWITRDPIGYGGGSNLYGYCGEGPVGSMDPSGFAPGDVEDGDPEEIFNGVDDAHPLSMRSFHPGMQHGTCQSTQANEMLGDLDTVVQNLPDAGEDAALEQAAARAPRGGVYKLTSGGKVMRTGRSGNLDVRRGQHKRTFPDYDFEPINKTDDPDAQRGLEQMAHDKYNPPLNFNRPIRLNNPKIGIYLDAAQKFLDNFGLK